MSLYNILFDQNSDSANLLRLLGINEGMVPRFRDCYWTGEYIVVHTRTGGGNRDYYESAESCRENYPDHFDGENDPSGPWNNDLRKLPGFHHDADDDFDSTYADFYFTPPAHAAEALSRLPADMPPAEKWQALFAALDNANSQASNTVIACKPAPEQCSGGQTNSGGVGGLACT